MIAKDGRAPSDETRHLAALVARLDSFLVRRPVLALVLPFPLFLAAGFALTAVGTSTWDTVAHHDHQLWLIGRWLGEKRPLAGGHDEGFAHMTLIGTLWEYVLAAACAVFGFLRDPLWVRHAVTFTLLPLTLLTTYQLLRRTGETAGTAILAVALVAGNVRFLGHSILNVNDFPLACGYLLVTLLMWTIFRERIGSAAGLVERPGWLAVLVLLSVVPYLLRVPVLQHWLVLTLLCLWVAATGPGRAGWGQRGAVVALPLVLGPLAVIVAMPGLWDNGLAGLVRSLTLFSKYPWPGPVRLFGLEFLSTELPWWYAPAWIAVAWVPIGLLTLSTGLALFMPRLWRELREGRPWPVQPLFTSLAAWVALFGGLPWAAFLLMRPTFYDEDRHLLFAMPLIGVAAALGLGRVSGRVKGALALLVLGSAAWSAVSWGPYAYVYKNPTLPRTWGDDFMGDYWGVSTGALAQAIYDHVPDHGYVFMIGPGPTLTRELQRRETSLVVRAPERRTFDLRQRARRRGRMYVAAINRNQLCRPLLEDVALGRARELWRAEMPGGDVAALLVYYEGRCDDCPERLRSGPYGPIDFKAAGGR